MKLIKPKSLQIGDCIGIISPSAGLAPFAIHRINNGVSYLRKMGLDVLIGKHALKNSGYVSSSIEARVNDIHEMFSNPKVKAIICTIGGNNSNQLLPYLDYKMIKKNPKIFIGYSDISVLHFALQSQAGLATFYGPCLMTQFGEFPEPLKYTIESFSRELFNDKKSIVKIDPSKFWTDDTPDWFEKKDLLGPRKHFKNSGYEWLKKGYGKGPAWGGTIPSINYLLGTKYWIEPKENIFFLDVPEGKDHFSGLPLTEADAYLTNLENAGVFGKINGLIVGRPYRYSNDDHKMLKNIILRITRNYKFPILYNVNIGHADPIITLRYGQQLEIDSKRNLFQVYG